ncbi:MAG: glycerophosphoryl diester phosphodiesterase membrane domain-containing protein, partial [Ruminococcus sp.]
MFRESMKLLRKTGRTLILFEAGLQLVTFIVLVPFIGAVAEGAIHLAGLKYLTSENIVKLLKSVWTLPAAALIILIITAQILLHFTGAIVCFRAAAKGQKLSFSELINELASSLKRMFAPGACTLVLHIVLLMPAISVPAAGGLLSVSGIPDILTRIISDPEKLVLIYSGSVVASILLSLRWMAAIPVYVCRRCSFRAARRQSRRLISGKSLRVFAGFLAWSFAFFTAFALSVIFVTWAGIFCISRTVGSVSYGSEYIQIIRYCLLFVAFLFSSAAVPYLSAGMFVRYEKFLSGRRTVGRS